MGVVAKAKRDNPIFDLMVSHLATVMVELFAGYGIPVRCRPAIDFAPTQDAGVSTATIGYMGDDVCGALTVLATQATVQAWLGASGSEHWDLNDALGEYSNMILGRLKCHLLVEGFPILLATPTIACGQGLRLSAALGQSSWLLFDGPGWQAGVRLDASFEAGFALQAASDREQPMEAGEALLF
jgi:CheY-specific phosphatase CheX